jgi:hypothetical protein
MCFRKVPASNLGPGIGHPENPSEADQLEDLGVGARIILQEVLGRTNRLRSLIRRGPHWKRRVQQFYCCVCIHYRGNVSTEPLPSNDRGTHITDTQTDENDF